MNDFVTLKVFTYQHEMVVVQELLHAAGIQTFVKDELTAQINPLFSNAIGGIKLQVPEKDLEQAIAILKEAGQLEETTPDTPTNGLDKITGNIPLIGKLGLGQRLLVLLILMILLVGAFVYFSS